MPARPTSGQGVARSPGGAGRHGGRCALPAAGAVSEDGRQDAGGGQGREEGGRGERLAQLGVRQGQEPAGARII